MKQIFFICFSRLGVSCHTENKLNFTLEFQETLLITMSQLLIGWKAGVDNVKIGLPQAFEMTPAICMH